MCVLSIKCLFEKKICKLIVCPSYIYIHSMWGYNSYRCRKWKPSLFSGWSITTPPRSILEMFHECLTTKFREYLKISLNHRYRNFLGRRLVVLLNSYMLYSFIYSYVCRWLGGGIFQNIIKNIIRLIGI